MTNSSDDAVRSAIVPDPTTATTQLLLREVGALKELVEQRMGAIDRAIDIAHQDSVRLPTDIQTAVAALKKLISARMDVHLEKFSGIDRSLVDSKMAVDAALIAAKEAVGRQQEANDKAINKSEAAFTKQIDQQAAAMAAVKSELGVRIDDIKERITTIQAMALGSSATTTDQRQSAHVWFGAAGLLFGLIGALTLIVSFFARG